MDVLQEKAARLVQETEISTLKVRIEDIQRHEGHVRELKDRAEATCNRLRDELDRVCMVTLGCVWLCSGPMAGCAFV